LAGLTYENNYIKQENLIQTDTNINP